MAIELTIPSVGESITEVQIGDWRKAPGDAVEKDEVLLTIESEKATIDLPAPAAGTLSRITKQKGEVAKVGDVVGSLDPAGPANPQAPPAAKPVGEKSSPAAKQPDAPVKQQEAAAKQEPADVKQETRVMPAARQALAEQSIDASAVKPTGPGGRMLKEDVLSAAGEKTAPPKPPPAPATMPDRSQASPARSDEIVPMTPLRRTVARRLVEAQQSMAMLTTFNEIDMSGLMTLRKSQQEAFQEKHKVKLGLMSFFIKATVDALGGVPQLNAEVRGTDIVYHRYYDIGVAIGGGKGLVVPVLRNAERLGFAQIELAIEDFARRAKENHLKPDELQGGTFTISNGGVYGSLMSTPIVNPPQSGILGLHTIKDRPVAVEGQVVVRPMMYVALSYDHRIVDGREAVMFLKRIKDIIESPVRLLLDL